ncbi:carboxymuconolactone decarboxylase family protein [Roseateles depolymerans]|uniref:Alkylhydroperoxidase n=1 Tax=Roseateles depolymerans TaxID=76731 RepID=A0A0U3LMP6_9BURK|nr:carboxymuconolactone decarboxylase family protein [Roseateles depolymerans]ALV07714.1 alkylhydroperoxidase [Roseateles depolymerans]REG22063.1 putative peroxidase-related enzyme [Roseateles depolymerans]
MSRIPLIPQDQLSSDASALFAQVKKAVGKVPNAYATIGGYSPQSLSTLLGADAALSKGALSRQEVEAIRLAVSEINGCDYCVAAHTMVGRMVGLSPEALPQIRAGAATGQAKLDALLHFVRIVQTTRGTVPAEVLQAVIDAGYTEQQVIEALLTVSMIGFTNLVNRVNDTELDFPKVA